MRYIIIMMAIVIVICSFGCTDASYGKFAILGNSAEVTCYSGGKVYFHAKSSGKVSNEQNSDGFFARWQDIDEKGKPTGKPYYASISGDCKIVYLDD